MDQHRAKIRSSKACKKRLEELFQPIEEKLENGEFDVEGGSDTYDEAINSMKEPYFATPDLGPMMKDQWEKFLEEITNRPVEMVDLDEPDDEDQPIDQVPHLNDQVPQGNEVAGARSCTAQTQSGDSEDDLLQSIPDPDVRAKFAKILKGANMDKTRETSRAACKARLDDVFKPIKQNLDTDVYDGEEGYTLYQMDRNEAIEAYQNTPDLGPMKGTTLDDYLDAIHSERPIEKMDENAKRWADNDQDNILKLLTAVMEHFQAFRKLFQLWLDNRSDNINWLRLKADSLDEEQKTSNKIVVAASSIGGATSTIAGGIAIWSVVLAPVTFGGSLALGLMVGSAGVGIGVLVAKLKTRKQNREYELNNYKKALTRLETDKEQTDEMMSIIKKLSQVGDDLASIGLRIDLQFTDEVVSAAKLSAAASKALGDISVCFGAGRSFAIIAYTLVHTIRNMKDGSKSKLATSLREIADILEQQVTDVVSISRGIEIMVNQAEDALTPLLKKYPLTVGRKDNELVL